MTDLAQKIHQTFKEKKHRALILENAPGEKVSAYLEEW